jgi:type III secretion protein D
MADGAVDARATRSDAAGLVLRVLAGANQGASMPLSDGPWTIGSGAAADLTFTETALAEDQLTLTIADGKAHVKVAASGVRVGGQELPAGTEQDLPALVPVAIGRTVFALGPANSDWGAIDIGAPVSDQVPDSVPAVQQDPQTNPAKRSQLVVEPADRQGVPPAPPNGLRSRFRHLLTAGIAALLLLIAVAGWWSMPGEPPPAVDPDAISRAQAAVRPLGVPAVTINEVEHRIVVGGRVATDRQLDELSRALRQARVNFELRVRSDAALIEQVRTVLKGYGIDADARIDDAGKLTVGGYADDDGKVEAALERLRNDVAGVGRFEDGVVTPERARRELDRLLQDAGLLDSLRLASAPRVVTVSGFVDASRLDRWTSAAERFRETYGNRVRLQPNITSFAATAPRGVRAGPEGYIVMQDGKQLRVGDTLGTTGTITGIETRSVRVRTTNGEVDLPFAKVPYWIVEDSK